MANETRARVHALLEAYNPASPDHDFDSIRRTLDSDYATFNVLCSAIRTSVVAQPLLLSLDHTQVVLSAAKDKDMLTDLVRWIGYIPETRPEFPRQEWFRKFALAGYKSRTPEILTKLGLLGHAKLVVSTHEWSPTDADLFLRIIDGEHGSRLGDSFLLAFLNDNSSPSYRQVLLTSFLRDIKDLDSWVLHILLNRKVLSPPSNLFVLLQSCEQLPETFFARIATVWADQTFILNSTFERHSQISAVVRYYLKHHFGQVPERIVAIIIKGVSEHLSSNVEEKRRLGMVVGEEFSAAHNPKGSATLDFGIDRETFLDEYAIGISDDVTEPPQESAMSNVAPDSSKKDIVENSSVNLLEIHNPQQILLWPWPDVPHELVGEDDPEAGDDDDACSLDSYDLADDLLEGIVPVPKHLSQLPTMLSADKYETVQSALVHLSDLIRIQRKRPDTARRAPRLVWTLLELENRFGLSDFELNRSKGLICLLVYLPKQSAPALARAVYSREISLGVKLIALGAYMDAVKMLAHGGLDVGVDSLGDRTIEDAEDKPQSLGIVTRRSRKLDTAGKETFKNELAPIAYEYFFIPLCRRVADFEDEPIILCKVVTALALVLERSRHAGGEALRMAEELIDILPWMKVRPEAEIRRAALYALAAIASVSKEFIEDWLDWLVLTAKDDPDHLSRELAKRIAISVAATED